MIGQWLKRPFAAWGTDKPSLPPQPRVVPFSTGLVHYRLGWKPKGVQAGLVSGTSAGMGDSLRAIVPWLEYPDPRRLDIRATLRDPFEKLWVRDFKRNTAISVIALVDASASMGYRGVYARPQMVAAILSVMAQSAYASGDAFGLYVAGLKLHPVLRLAPKINRSAPVWLARQWRHFVPQGHSAEGLLAAVALLPKRQSLVLLISDFHWPEPLLQQLYRGLSHHDVVPVLLRDPAEAQQLPAHGFAELQDMEHGGTAFVWMNKGTRQWLAQRAAAHETHLRAVSARFGITPFVVEGAFEPSAFSAYFQQRQ